MIAGATGCDNVVWGGAEVQIVPPPPPRSAIEIESDTRAFAEFGLPTGPVLFHLTERDGMAQLVPAAEVVGDSIRGLRRPSEVSPEAYATRFRQTVLPLGATFEVYRRGARVGTFVAEANGPLTACGLPTVTGSVTVVAAAVGSNDFIAFREGLSPVSRGEFSPPPITGSIRTYASIVAERLILRAGLPRPRSWPGAQRDLQSLEISGGGEPEMAATYLVGDNLGIGAPDPNGYSVFYLADYETQRGYMPIYSEVRDFRTASKATPRLIDHVDVNEDASPEILLQVYGTDQSWYEVLGLRNGEWRKIYEGSACG